MHDEDINEEESIALYQRELYHLIDCLRDIVVQAAIPISKGECSGMGFDYDNDKFISPSQLHYLVSKIPRFGADVAVAMLEDVI
jgi:hypothetical protein